MNTLIFILLGAVIGLCIAGFFMADKIAELQKDVLTTKRDTVGRYYTNREDLEILQKDYRRLSEKFSGLSISVGMNEKNLLLLTESLIPRPPGSDVPEEVFDFTKASESKSLTEKDLGDAVDARLLGESIILDPPLAEPHVLDGEQMSPSIEEPKVTTDRKWNAQTSVVSGTVGDVTFIGSKQFVLRKFNEAGLLPFAPKKTGLVRWLHQLESEGKVIITERPA